MSTEKEVVKIWHPTIDTSRCVDDCFKCLHFCPQGVFEKKGKRPIVANPEKCLEGCDSCEHICPEGAITFLTNDAIVVDGVEVGLKGIDKAFEQPDFEHAFDEIRKNNYIPEGALEKFRNALKQKYKK